MTDQQHPISPSPELIEQWFQDWDWRNDGPPFHEWIVIKAAQWGADMELEACCEWVEREIGHGREWGAELRRFRRPKPPSLKELAKLALSELNLTADPDGAELSRTQVELIRNTLEAFLND